MKATAAFLVVTAGAQHGEFLAQHKQLEVLRARRVAGEEQEPEYLAKGDVDRRSIGTHERS